MSIADGDHPDTVAFKATLRWFAGTVSWGGEVSTVKWFKVNWESIQILEMAETVGDPLPL